jgi:hypothetical protein
MKHIYSILVVLILSGCISSRKYSKMIDSIEDSFCHNQEVNLPENIIFNTDSIEIEASNVKVMQSYILPGIIYWKWKRTMKCAIDPEFAINNLKQSLASYAANTDLNKKLGGRKLEISVTKIPNHFYYTKYGNIFLLLISPQMHNVEVIVPDNQSLKLTYKIFENNGIERVGELVVINKDVAMKNKKNTTQKLTYSFIEHHQDVSEKLAYQVVQKLYREL